MPNKYDISFIVPIRDRDEMKPHFEKSIAENFSDYSYEIIYVEQCDNKPFMVAQLRNIGFLHSNGDYIAPKDVDILDIEHIDLINVYKALQGPYRAYDRRQHVIFDTNDNMTYYLKEHTVTGYGAYSFYTKEDIIKHNGFTNLCIGWGYEDDITRIVYNLKTYSRVNGHIWHEDNEFLNRHNTIINSMIYSKYINGEIDYNFDGYKQMTYDIIDKSINENITHIKVTNIGVVDDFIYKDLYNKHFEKF